MTKSCVAWDRCWRRAYTEFQRDIGYSGTPPTRQELFIAGYVKPDMVDTNKRGIWCEVMPVRDNVDTYCPNIFGGFENCPEYKHYLKCVERDQKRKFSNQSPRLNLTQETRRLVAAEAHYRCVYCGRAHNQIRPDGSKVRGVVDHFVPLALGGLSDISNLVFACSKCNREKGIQIWKKGIKYGDTSGNSGEVLSENL